MSMLTAAWTMTSPFLGLVPRGGPVCAATGLATYRLHCTATGQLHQRLEAILRRCWWGAASAPHHPLRAERQSHSVVHRRSRHTAEVRDHAPLPYASW